MLASSLFLCYSDKLNINFAKFALKIYKNPQRPPAYKNQLKAFINQESIKYEDVYNILSNFYFSDAADILTE